MKEATGEVSMTVITLVAIAIIGAILALLWPNIKNRINAMWDSTDTNSKSGCEAIGGTWTADGKCLGGNAGNGGAD